jgi:hypothetical protein
MIIGWELAASLWRCHLPNTFNGTHVCASCHLRMPCPCWQFADAFLAEAIEPSAETAPPVVRPTDDVTRELPRVERRPLPQRQPGAHLQAEERYDGWFTRSD